MPGYQAQDPGFNSQNCEKGKERKACLNDLLPKPKGITLMVLLWPVKSQAHPNSGKWNMGLTTQWKISENLSTMFEIAKSVIKLLP